MYNNAYSIVVQNVKVINKYLNFRYKDFVFKILDTAYNSDA